ncbi:MAG: bifunctional DNA-binding transcriptional regulator/O6-methylguanine-DNA methyltransferase Ada [Sinobacteraceae bacterium]|nr:bifunctional DNA-binding transcriptional regulator/O6-methylguanine-DNA methyltransferase Ada [Nevskiaceae bacterium]MCP5470681.1 bifunctional DNA-binding transcriptional regulator/O6-methylguanine-DNA methyltransferase Ada [Nevskiaceae bacterium]
MHRSPNSDAMRPRANKTGSTQSDPRWADVLARNTQADGRFVYAVRTTGIYCRPSCSARRPRPENVTFHADAAAAERAGFRPCRRCHPAAATQSTPHVALVARACREIERCDTIPSLQTLAQAAGISPFHFHRIFKAATGVTPRAYAMAHRERRLRARLDPRQGSGTVTEAIYDAGFNSSTRAYAQAADILGMTPSTWRAGGAATRIRFAIARCTLGALLIAHSGRGLCAILLGDDPEALLQDLQARFSEAELIGGDADFERVIAQVVAFVEAPQIGLDLPLDIRGTAFQRRVWEVLRKLPAGTTASYAEIARRIGSPRATRAVASACAANALAVAIPCHRVVCSDGSLSGYRWGIERKRQLLAREAAAGAPHAPRPTRPRTNVPADRNSAGKRKRD